MGACGSWGLLAVVALATMHAADSAPVSVGSFSELNLAVSSGVRAIDIAAPNITFDHQLLIESTALLIESTVGATLSGGNQTRLIFLQNGSKLSLRGVNLVGGVSGRCFNCMSHGGAVFVSGGSELSLLGPRVQQSGQSKGRCNLRDELYGRRNRVYDELKHCVFLGWRDLCDWLQRHHNRLYNDLKLCWRRE